MTLRAGLLVSGALALLLAAASLQLLRQVDALLRQAQEQALLASASTLARALQRPGTGLPLHDPAGPGLGVLPLASTPRLDGFADDWAPWHAEPLPVSEAAALPVSLLVGEDRRGVYLWLFAADQTRVRAGQSALPGAPLADQLVLHLAGEAGRVRYRFVPAGPGGMDGERLDPPLRGFPLAVEAGFQERAEGWSLELALPPLPADTRLAVEVLDWARAGDRQPLRRGGTLDQRGEPWLHGLRTRPPLLHDELHALAPTGSRARIVDAQGWVRAQSGELGLEDPNWMPAQAGDGFGRWLQRRLLAGRLLPAQAYQPELARLDNELLTRAAEGQAALAWRIASDQRTVVRMAAVRIDDSAVLLLEQSAEALVTLTRTAFGWLTLLSLAALLGSSAALLAFGSLTRWRILRLRDAAERALGEDGELRGFTPSRSVDALGDLSRSFAQLLDALAGYTDYLRGLGARLSHELHTPLAIVRSSLDNLDEQPLPDSARVYVERARDGAQRMAGLLRALGEASRVEQAVRVAEAEDFDLAALLRECCAAYAALRPDLDLVLQCPEGPALLHGAPELVVQALDKLWDNAAGFCPPGGWLRVRLQRSDEAWVLAVANQGPPLPEQLRGRLFDSMVSLRPRGDGGHLGLGLYIVRLVAARHRGSVLARDLPQRDGVEIVIVLRGMPRQRLHGGEAGG